MATVKVSDSSFKSDVIDSERPVLVDFWAEWCGPCKQIGPALEELSEELGDKMKIAKVNIDDDPETPGKFHVRGIPTLMIFKGGQVVATKVGVMSKSKLSEWVAALGLHRPGRLRVHQARKRREVSNPREDRNNVSPMVKWTR